MVFFFAFFFIKDCFQDCFEEAGIFMEGPYSSFLYLPKSYKDTFSSLELSILKKVCNSTKVANGVFVESCKAIKASGFLKDT